MEQLKHGLCFSSQPGNSLTGRWAFGRPGVRGAGQRALLRGDQRHALQPVGFAASLLCHVRCAFPSAIPV